MPNLPIRCVAFRNAVGEAQYASRGKRGGISDDEMPGMWNGFRKKEHTASMGTLRGVEIEDIKNMSAFARMPFSEIPDVGP